MKDKQPPKRSTDLEAGASIPKMQLVNNGASVPKMQKDTIQRGG